MLLPRSKFELNVDAPPSIVAERLRSATGKTQWLTLGRRPEAFQGEVGGDSFRVQRIIYYRNSFVPIADGRIEPTATGSTVRITMRLHRVVAVFMTFWLGSVGALTVMFGIAALSKPESGSMTLIPLFMLVMGFGMEHLGFRIEAPKTREALSKILISRYDDGAKGL